LATIHNEKKSISSVAEAYGITKSTLHDHSSGKVERVDPGTINSKSVKIALPTIFAWLISWCGA